MTAMRALFVLAALLMGFTGIACKGDKEASETQAAKVTDEISTGEQDLLRRRDTLLKARRKLREERKELNEKRQQVIAVGGDLSEIEKRVEELSKEEEELGTQEDEFNLALENLFSQQRALLTSIAGTGDDTARIAAREASMAGREKVIATREERIAARESELAARERALAAREKETCSVAAAPAPVVIEPPPGSKYRKRDVEPLLKRARKAMSKKGILPSDLPPSARSLEKDATRAMADGDYGTAFMAATQLEAVVEDTKLDKAFIQAKFSRLNTKVSESKLDGKEKENVEALMAKAAESYGDGKFSTANKQLNEIYAELD